MKLLIIEDERSLADSLEALLQTKGFETQAVYDGKNGLAYAELDIYDLVILDVTLPELSGYDIARKLRAMKCGIPILMLTARSGLEDRIEGLNAGADYYLTKPVDPRELLACIHALLRRQGSQVNELSFGNTSLDLASGILTCGKETIRLSAKEFEVMRLLLQNPSRNLSKETILAHVWGYDSNAVENHVEVYVGFLRKKLSAIRSNVSIVAIRRLGYHLETHTWKAIDQILPCAKAILVQSLSYLCTLAPAPPMIASTSFRLAIVVSPGVVMARAPWAAP